MTEPEGPGMAGGDLPSEGAGEELVGSVIGGRYRLLKLLGKGAMGAVYLGEHTRIGRHDAIKILRKGLTSDAESIARFNRGARNLSAIRHPNVCTLYDYGETADGSPFLALELIDGESLADLVAREKSLDAHRAVTIALQTAQALDAAHHAGIVHRDLKPANIMLERGRDGGDVVKVVDFDIAKGPEPEGGDEVTRLGYVVGTPEYMSPEQLTGEKLDGRSDIYSLGVTLYRMLTGLLPFRGTDVQKIMLERLTERPVPLAESRPDLAFPEQVQDVLDRALARDRGERYPRAADFARELTTLQQTIASAPVGVRGPRDVPDTRVAPSGSHSSPKPIAPPAHARRAPAWMFVAGALVVAAAGITAYVKIQDAVASDRSSDSSIPTNPAGGEGDPPLVSGGDSTDSGGGSVAPVGSGSGGQTDPVDPPPQPTSLRLTADSALEVLFDQEIQLVDDAGPFGVTTNAVMARAAADTAATLWATPGITRGDSALAAYVRGMAAIALRDREGCIRWLDRASEAGNSGAESLRLHCNRIDN